MHIRRLLFYFIIGEDTYFREYRNLHRFQELDRANHAFPTVPFPHPARVRAQPEFMQHDRVPPFQNLDVTDTRVRDVRVDAICTVPAWSCARSTGDGLSKKNERHAPMSKSVSVCVKLSNERVGREREERKKERWFRYVPHNIPILQHSFRLCLYRRPRRSNCCLYIS